MPLSFSLLTSLAFVTTRPIMQAWWHSLLPKFLSLLTHLSLLTSINYAHR